MGRDSPQTETSDGHRTFQSTLPAWGETQLVRVGDLLVAISIHSPRMGRDPRRAGNAAPDADFNPLSPHGERLKERRVKPSWSQFQSTLPAWGETRSLGTTVSCWRFQSTLPAWGETFTLPSGDIFPQFQSTLPAWGETAAGPENRPNGGISIHSPRMGRDAARPCR